MPPLPSPARRSACRTRRLRVPRPRRRRRRTGRARSPRRARRGSPCGTRARSSLELGARFLLRVGIGRGERVLDRAVHPVVDLRVLRREVVLVESQVQEPRAGQVERVACEPALDLLRGAVLRRVGLRVPVVAVGLTFEQGGPRTPPRPGGPPPRPPPYR